MTTHRIQPVRVAVLGLTALLMLFHGSGWAQSKGGDEPAAQATAAAAKVMEPQSLETLLDDTDAIVQGFMSEPAPNTSDAGSAGHRDDDWQYPVSVFRMHYPVVVFQRADNTLGLDSGLSWTQTIDVRLFNYAGRALTPGAESLLFLQLLTMDFRRFIHALILIPTQIKTGGRRLTFRILSYTRWVRLILGGSQRLRQLQLA